MKDSNAEEAEHLESLSRFVRQRGGRAREPQQISDVISRLLARRGYAQAQAVNQLQESWASAVGERLAKHSRPAQLSRGRLDIVVRNSTVLQELSFQKQQLLTRMQTDELSQAIRDLRFRIGTLD